MEKQMNALTASAKKELAVKLEEGELGSILKPLIREIFLFDSYVAGTHRVKDEELLDELKIGDTLTLQRENNKFDPNAIVILTKDKKKVGYIPERDNIVFARLMDAGKLLNARVKTLDRTGDFRKIGIGINLIDF